MKVVSKDQLSHRQLQSQISGELYSLSEVVSETLGSKQLFIHHDIISPAKRSSGSHRHTVIEEVIYIVKGSVTLVSGEKETKACEGAFVLFDPAEKKTHYLINKSDEDVETITLSISSAFDAVLFEESQTYGLKIPTFHFDSDLRDIPNDPQEWELFRKDLKTRLETVSHSEERLQLFEHLGMAARVLMRLGEAESFLMKAVRLSYAHPSARRVAQNFIRLAHVYQWKREFGKAQLLFDQAKSLIYEAPTSEGFIAVYHQHLGKLYFDQEFFGKAQAEFAVALSIRERISAPEDQIKSSRNSLFEALRRWDRVFGKGMYIRRATLKDAEGIHRAHMNSIQEICSKDYSLEEIQGWGGRPYVEAQRVNAIINDIVWVIENQGSIEGFGHFRIFDKAGLKSGHIFGLYLTSQMAGKSFGKVIIDIMMEEAYLANLKKVTLQATITARSFYHKNGFIDDGPPRSVEIGGSSILCYPMKIELL